VASRDKSREAGRRQRAGRLLSEYMCTCESMSAKRKEKTTLAVTVSVSDSAAAGISLEEAI